MGEGEREEPLAWGGVECWWGRELVGVPVVPDRWITETAEHTAFQVREGRALACHSSSEGSLLVSSIPLEET